MRILVIELQKEKRAGAVPVLLLIGFIGAAYELLNYAIRKESLLSLPFKPMDILLTQLYGMVMILNLFGIVVAACIIYNIEFKGNALKKMYVLPINMVYVYLNKFLILGILLTAAVVIQNIALICIGVINLPQGSFRLMTLIRFAGYSLLTSLPVLSFMLLISSLAENMWVTLGIGVAGFLSGMSLVNYGSKLLLIHPVVIMLKPAVAMSTSISVTVSVVAIIETIIFLISGAIFSKHSHHE